MIGKNIYSIRKSRGLSLSELAERAKVSKSYLSNIERNLHHNPSVNVLEKIALVLDVELQELLSSNENTNSKISLDNEWVEFILELKKSGIEKDQIEEYKTLIEFIRWKREVSESNK